MVKKLYLGLVFLFLYAPILVLIVNSFNSSRSGTVWTGFSLGWYEELFRDHRIRGAFQTTIAIAALSTTISTIVGTLSAIGIHKLRPKWQSIALNINYFPVINPEIVTAISLMLLFRTIRLDFGFATMLLAHIIFSIPYVILAILPRLGAMNPHLAEAAMDLGATPMQAILKVVIPEIRPSIFTGALMAFTMSLDDFVISFFNTGAGVTNLSIEIYSMARRGIRPTVNALATLMVFVVFTVVLIANRVSIEKVKGERRSSTQG